MSDTGRITEAQFSGVTDIPAPTLLEDRIAEVEKKLSPVPGMPQMNLAQAVGRIEAVIYEHLGHKHLPAERTPTNVNLIDAICMEATARQTAAQTISAAIDRLTDELKKRRS